MGPEVANFLGKRFIDSEADKCSDSGLVPVVAWVESARDPLEGLLSSWVHRAGARLQQVDRVPRRPSAASHADDERRSVGFDGGVSGARD